MRRASEHKLRGKVRRLSRPRGRDLYLEWRPGNQLVVRAIMGDVLWSVRMRGFSRDDPRIPQLRSDLERASQTGECDAAINRAVGRIGRGARCFEAIRARRRGNPPAQAD